MGGDGGQAAVWDEPKGHDHRLLAEPDKFELLATNDLGKPSHATPAISDGQIFLRTDRRLYCVGNN